MTRRALIAAATTVIAGGAAAFFAPSSSKVDYSAIPPTADKVADSLHACNVNLAKAVDIAEKLVHGLASSASVDLNASPPTIEIHVYTDKEARTVVVNTTSGEIVSNEVTPRFPGKPVTGDWTETNTGLKFFDIKVGDGAQITNPNGDTVTLNFTWWLVDGTQIGSTQDRGQPAVLGLSELNAQLPGLVEGLASMKAGGERKFIIPSNLGLGANGMPPQVPANATLIFDVELLDVQASVDYSTIPAMLPGEAVAGEPVSTASGLKYYDIKVGDGQQPAGPQASVTVQYTGWLNNGTKFDSSFDHGQAATFQLSSVIKGWTEGVGSMKIGGKRKFIIPAALAYGPSGRPPTIPANATLIFDVELLETK